MATQHSSKITGHTGEGRGSGHKGPAKGSAFGIASVTQALEGVSFPISKKELLRQQGKTQIHWKKDSVETLGDILKNVPQEEFPSMADVASSVSEFHKRVQTH